MDAPSTEVAIPSARLLCEEIIRRHGTDRGNGERIRVDADIEGRDIDGTPYKFRLIQQNGVGSLARYTLRARPDLSSVEQSEYRYDVAKNKVYHVIGEMACITWRPKDITGMLYEALEGDAV